MKGVNLQGHRLQRLTFAGRIASGLERNVMSRLALCVALLCVAISPSLQAIPQAGAAQPPSPIVSAAEAGKILPATVFFQGQSASIQARNSAGVRFAKDSYLLVALVDSSGYSSEVQQKYQGYLIAEEPIEVAGRRLAPGAYGCGFISGDQFLVMDIGGHTLLTVTSTHDAALHRPVPLQILPDGSRYRLYFGRNYVALTAPAR